ncbi:hypothetical protein DM860_002065 [Cuscuta australis]|uniref:F-box domain-containing protein n=1 Tax=Cuscuta australis TaxID=267555 RepID=A0A328DVP7_9ASTE|nr:hypothetical protein DM860_002065 [Cuscuta australis]
MDYAAPDLRCKVCPDPVDQFDRLPDSLVLVVFNMIGDVKALGRCCVVSRRFHSLVPQVDNVVVRVDCVISDEDGSSSSSSSSAASDKSRHPISSLIRLVVMGLLKPFQSLTQLISAPTAPRRFSASPAMEDGRFDQNSVTHHSPTQVLKNFEEIKFLRIELPSGELGIDDGVLLKWRADFGSTLDTCVILGASSVTHPTTPDNPNRNPDDQSEANAENDNGSIPESFYTSGGLKLRVVWTISSLIAASARHYLLQPIIAEHRTLDNLILTDMDGQGVLCMNREQLEELRVKPLSASSASKRTMVPALNMRLWFAPHLVLPDGTVLKGATLVAIRPSEQKKDVVGSDGNWVASAFDEPYGTAARLLVKGRTYCLEMNSF